MDITYIGEKPKQKTKQLKKKVYETIFPTARPIEQQRNKIYKGDLTKEPNELIFGNLEDFLAYQNAYLKRAQKSSS